MSDPQHECFEEVLEEHRRLNQLIHELESFIAAEPRPAIGEQGYQQWAETLHEKLLSLDEVLEGHFRHEESCPLPKPMDSAAITRVEVLRRLREEHEELLSALRGLRAAALAYSQEVGADTRALPPRDPRLRIRASDFLRRITVHEVAETETMQALFTDELGSGD